MRSGKRRRDSGGQDSSGLALVAGAEQSAMRADMRKTSVRHVYLQPDVPGDSVGISLMLNVGAAFVQVEEMPQLWVKTGDEGRFVAGVAEESGAVHAGDFVVGVCGVSTLGLSPASVGSLIKQARAASENTAVVLHLTTVPPPEILMPLMFQHMQDVAHALLGPVAEQVIGDARAARVLALTGGAPAEPAADGAAAALPQAADPMQGAMALMAAAAAAVSTPGSSPPVPSPPGAAVAATSGSQASHVPASSIAPMGQAAVSQPLSTAVSSGQPAVPVETGMTMPAVLSGHAQPAAPGDASLLPAMPALPGSAVPGTTAGLSTAAAPQVDAGALMAGSGAVFAPAHAGGLGMESGAAQSASAPIPAPRQNDVRAGVPGTSAGAAPEPAL